MKKFEKDGKINFVDENNVFVGYDLNQDCCEHAGWFISDGEEDKIYDETRGYEEIHRVEFDINEYVFDTDYFVEVNCPQVDAGAMIRFKLISKNQHSLYLHLFNVHNGYYGHGFKLEIGGKIIKDQYL